MPKSASELPAEAIALYDRLVATQPAVERKGATMPYTSVNGHMFSFLTKEGALALRLPDKERAAFLKKYKTKLCEQHGTVMTEYVLVPDALLKRTKELARHFAASYLYATALKPKAGSARKQGTPARGKAVAARRKGRS
jgi:hypothetical protein